MTDGATPDHLLYANVQYVPTNVCSSLVGSITDQMMCAGYFEVEGICQGDSGGKSLHLHFNIYFHCNCAFIVSYLLLYRLYYVCFTCKYSIINNLTWITTIVIS